MKKRESKFCVQLKHWLEYNMKETCFIEAKVSVDDKPFNFRSGIKSHQLPTLLKIKDGSFCFKPSDAAMTTQPYDIAFSYKAKSYIAIHWVRKSNKTFYLIDPKTIQYMIDTGIKSLDEKTAMVIADIIGTLK